MVVKTRRQKLESNNDFSQIIGDGLPLSAVLRDETDIPLSKIQDKYIIYVVGNNTIHDRKVVKVGRAQNAIQRLKSYIHAWGTNNLQFPSSGVKLLYLRIIKKEFVDIYGDVNSRLNIVESNLLRKLREIDGISLITSRGRETFYSKRGRKFMLEAVRDIMNQQSTFSKQHSTGIKLKPFTRRMMPQRTSQCDSALRAMHKYCDMSQDLQLFQRGKYEL